MSKFLTYNPQSVMIPPDIAARCATLLRHPVDSYPPDLAINGGYVLFHDVFRTINDDKILAVGTGWQNITKTPYFNPKRKHTDWQKHELYKLKEELVPLSVNHAGKQLRVKYKPLYGHVGQFGLQKLKPVVGLYEIEMSHEMSLLDEISLQFEWLNFSVELKLPHNPLKLPKTDLTLHTLQRDNHPLWVSDWCRYYYRQHGVKRIVIYNNLDDNSDAIVKNLRELPDDIEVIYINWPYRYNYEIYFNCAQVVGINHCSILLADTSNYYLNFDLDEYLINNNNINLAQLLDSKTNGLRQTSSVLVRQWLVPYFSPDIDDDTLPRVWHFQHCYSKGASSNSNKTINRYGRFEGIWQHTATPLWPKYLRFLLHSNVVTVFLAVLHNLFPYFRYTLHPISKRNRILRTLKILSKIPILGKIFSLIIANSLGFLTVPHKLYFYHYQAIGTNWTGRRTGKQQTSDTTKYSAVPNPIKKSQIYLD